MAFLHGKNGFVQIGATVYAFGHWTADLKNNPGKVTNFTGLGYRQLITGITEATISIDGPYDAGNMAFAIGAAYILNLGFSNVISLTVTTICTGIKPDVDIEKEQRVALTFEQTGPFVAAIV